MLCICGHRHLTTRGHCTMFDTCKCRHLRPQRVRRTPTEPAPVFVDTPADIARRTRELMDAVDACPHGIKHVTRRRTR
jgi:hypothetical protein